MNTGKVVLAFLVLGMAWALLVPGITYGFNLEYEIICPPSDGTTWSGKFSDEPLKKNLNTGRITRIRGPVKRAIAKLACENVSIPECGDDICSSASGENALTCETDCPSECGDGLCASDESVLTCPKDCPPVCEDGICNSYSGENMFNCPADCPSECGDGFCSSASGEDPLNCSADCWFPCSGTFCGNACVDLSEDEANCGECGVVCDVGDTCMGGVCMAYVP